MKRFAAFFAAVIIIFSLSGCSAKKKTALVIAGTEINSEIFTYYLDKVCQAPQDYGLAENPPDKELKQTVIKECKKYLAANTSFRDKDLTLTASEKVEISQAVNNHWIRFENHYKKIGVSKQTLTKILTSQAYGDALFASEYDKGTDDAESETVLQDYFYENYISFRTVCAYYTAADGSPMTQLEKTQLLATMDTLAESAGTNAEEFAQAAQSAGFSLSGSVLLKKGADTYPHGFYEKVSVQEDDSVQIITYDECVFIVWKENLRDKGESVYINYRSACISDLYYEDYQKKLNSYLNTLTVEEKRVVDSIVNKIA